jgi:hypothetical protein
MPKCFFYCPTTLQSLHAFCRATGQNETPSLAGCSAAPAFAGTASPT